jgi:hypothetical protein
MVLIQYLIRLPPQVVAAAVATPPQETAVALAAAEALLALQAIT